MKMELTRRAFFGTAVLAAGGTLFAKSGLGAPNIKVGVISDIHVVPDRYNRQTRQYFLKVLNLFKKADVDAVIIAGDLTDRGIMSEMVLVSESWYEVFPDDKNNGKKVEKIFVTGNHDAGGYRWMTKDPEKRAEHAKEGLDADWNGNWRKLFREDYSPIFLKTVKGYAFVGAHWKEWHNGKLEKFLEENKDKLDSSKPFFYAQHPHLSNTVFGDWAWGAWDDREFARKALGKYPNAFAFSGHAHYSLTDERNVWQGEFTAVGTSSTSYTANPSGRTHPRKNASPNRQAMIMNVWDDVVTLERYDLVNDEKLDEDWVVPVLRSASGERKFAFENRSKETKAPEFPEGVKFKQTVKGYVKGDNAQGEFTLAIPAIKARDWRCRVYDYEVAVETTVCDVTMVSETRRVFATGYNISAKRAVEDTVCVFPMAGFPKVRSHKRSIRFGITPLNCFGKRGKTVWCDFNPKYEKAPKTEKTGNNKAKKA
jgi:3',5'-cyclic AMP phosphodiesterase CpdA